jgi:predicted nucleic acid-binding protein
MTDETWSSRDLPVLRAVVDICEESGTYLTRATAVERRTDLDTETVQRARVAGQLARRFRRSHSGIDDLDYLIPARAIVTDAGLLTANVPPLPDVRRAERPY